MMSQKCVWEKIIWAVAMVVLCTFLTFFVSNFMEKSFPNIEVAHRVVLPVLLFLLLGIVSFCLQGFFVPLVKNVTVPKAVKIIIPCLILVAGIVIHQFYYLGNFYDLAVGSEAYEHLAYAGGVYEEYGFSLKGIYENGLSMIRILLGDIAFSISVYQRIFLVLSAILLYFTVKNFTGREAAANLFLVLFLFGKPVLDFILVPDATVVYMVLVSLFLFALSFVFAWKQKEDSLVMQIVSMVGVVGTFALLILLEQNSVILLLPAVLVFFSGYDLPNKKQYFLYAGVGTGCLLLTVLLGIFLDKIVLSQYVMGFYKLESVDAFGTTILILNIIGFLGVYGIWHQKLYYVIPFVMGIFYLFFGTNYTSGVDNHFMLFFAFVFYAIFGVSMLTELPFEEVIEEEWADEMQEENIVTDKMQKEEKTEKTQEEKENQEEIQAIREMNEKLNDVDLEFIPMTFKKPKKKEKKAIDYAYEPTEEEMKYDVEVSEDDDFDV